MDLVGILGDNNQRKEEIDNLAVFKLAQACSNVYQIFQREPFTS